MNCTKVHFTTILRLHLAPVLLLACALSCSGQILIQQPDSSQPNTSNIAPCNALNASGVCDQGGVCVQGACYTPGSQPAACSSTTTNGVCADATAACVDGNCTPVVVTTACSPSNVTGLCPGGQTCVDGYCFTDDGTLACSAANPLGFCPTGESCTNGNCAVFFPTCNASDFSGKCPTWETCSEGTCIGPVPPDGCSATDLTGRCPATESCVGGTCTGVTTTNACSPNNPTGLCLPGSACGDNGHCIAVSASNICSASRPTGLCANGALCRGGACVQASCGNGGLACPLGQYCSGNVCAALPCDPIHPNGTCVDSTQACVNGACNEPTCSALEPNGACESGLVCNGGTCTLPPCALTSPNGPCPDAVNQVCTNGACVLRPCSVASPQGACPIATCTNDPEYGCIHHMAAQCCDANLSAATTCAVGQCAPPACSPQNPNGACETGYCVNGNCSPAPCSPFFLGGFCTDANQQCVQGGCAKVGCASQAGDQNVFCSPYICDTVRNICVQPPCSPAHPTGSCSAGTACCSTDHTAVNYQAVCQTTGTCVVPTCSVRYPGGFCADANQVCAAGACTTPPCSASYPHGTCGPNFACDANRGACSLLPCATSAGHGYCPSGQTCEPQGNGYTCVPYICGNEFPQGPCINANLGQICTQVGNNNVCVTPPCSVSYPGGVCSTAGTVCSNGNCVPAGCSAAYPNGVCPRSQNCTANHCVLQNCATADPNDSGTCPSGQACCNNALIAKGYCDQAHIKQCVAETCSATFPFGSCTNGNQICASVSNVVGCHDVCGSAHPTGYCPGGFACVERGCSQPCTNDQDCDTISDSDEGLAMGIDTNGDGVPDAYSHDSDGDTIPDSVEAGDHVLATPPVTTLAGGVPNFRSLDSDGDLVWDRVEAGGTPGVPQDTDSDGKPDYVDTDSDGDGIRDRCEATDGVGGVCHNSTMITSAASLTDTDNDGTPDMLSLDSDADKVPDTIEARTQPAVASTLNPNGVAHNTNGVPDYRNPDSDGDGVHDIDEDVNGNGIVDCQVDGNNVIVPDTRATPACNSTSSPFGTYASGGQPYDYNPGCPTNKCLFAETNRVFADTDGNGIGDASDGVFYVCSAANLKPINIFYSQQADYALALEQTYTLTSTLKQSSAQIGITFNDGNTGDGSYPVSGMLIKRTPAAAAIGTTTGATPAQVLINKALAQAQVDYTTLTGISGVSNVTVVVNRNTTSFDGYGVVVTRYELLTSGSVTSGNLRDNIALAFAGSIDNFTPSNAGPSSQDFILTVETLYRYDNGSNAGTVLSVGALAPAGANESDASGYNYRTKCSAQGTQGGCQARTGCLWNGSACGEDPTYQIPLFYADNITNGSAVTQYGDDIAALCQSLVQSNGLLDVLWTVDNSGSMADKIGQVVAASSLFFPFLSNSEADYRVGMITTTAQSNYWQPESPGCYGITDRVVCANLNGSGTANYTGTTNYGGCTWNTANSTCVPMCSIGTSSASCTALPGCGWNSTTSKCTWAGCTGVTDQSTCKDMLACTWSTISNSCVLDGTPDLVNGSLAGDFTGAVAGIVNTTANDRSVNYGCSEGCTINSCGGYNASNCNTFLACTWDAPNNKCVTNCCPACLDNTSANPNDPGCYFAARLPNDNGSGNEFGLLMTEWALYKAGAAPTCAGATNAAACGSLPGCEWSNAGGAAACVESFCSASINPNQAQCNGWPTGSNSALTPPVPGTSMTTAIGGSYTPANCEWNPSSSLCYPSFGPALGVASGISGASDSQRCNAYTTATTCASVAGAGCAWISTGGANGYCVPYEPPNTVLCNATSQAACTAQGYGTCQWDTCTSYNTSNACRAVNGCGWTPTVGTNTGTCAALAHGGACRPPLRRMMRANAAKVSVIVSDEEECFVKDGPGSTNNGTNVMCSNGATNQAYDGACCGGQYTGGLLAYTDPVRIARTTAYTNFMLGRNVTTFGLVGDAPNTALAPATTSRTNGGCQSTLGYTAEAGEAYIAVGQGTGGGWGSICAADLFPAIESICIAGLSKASPYKLEGFIAGHAVQPISSTIKVATQNCNILTEYPTCQSGTKVTVVPRSRDNGFDYDATNNALLLYGSARPVTNGTIAVSYRYWVNNNQPPGGTSGLCPCPSTSEPNCACPPGEACGASTSNGGMTTTNKCVLEPNSAACNLTPGCTWNTANNGFCEVTGLCEPDPTCGGCTGQGQKCDAKTGLCVCDPTCGGACQAGSTCDNNENINGCSTKTQAQCSGNCAWNATLNLCVSNTCGQCVCDTTCGGGCPAGEICNTNHASPTCGQCYCDTTCGGSCPTHEVCNSNTTSPTCGLCQPPACGHCPTGYICSPTANICVCDVTCGGGTPPAGQICDTDPNSATCGTLVCDRTCGGGCPTHEVCSNNPNSNTCGFCEPDPTCGKANANCNPTCSGGTTSAACGAISGCHWKLDASNNFACYPITCELCDSGSGYCKVDTLCTACGCNSYETCDPASGQCVCDTTCHNTVCPTGTICNRNEASSSCGQCMCDTTCGGPCAAGEVCDTTLTSGTCGTCIIDAHCGVGCQFPLVCNSTTGLCGPDPQCGGCPTGFVCNVVDGKCEPFGG